MNPTPFDYKTLSSIEDCYRATGRTPGAKPIVDHLPEVDRVHTTNRYDRLVITEAINLNEDGTVWLPDYTDGIAKIDPWFEIKATKEKPHGIGFSDSGYVDWLSHSDAGARLCFRDTPRWRFAINTFPDVFKEDIIGLDRVEILSRLQQA